MKIKPYIEKLEASETYKNFKVKYPDASLVAGFFVLDFETNQNIHQIDFYVPSEKKFAAFSLDKEISLKMLKSPMKIEPEKLDIKTNIDLDALKGILQDEMKNRSISEEIKKMIAVIQNVKGKKIWNVNCVLSGMEILRAHVEDDSQTVLKIEKISMADIIKKVPPEQLQEMKEQAQKSKAPKKEEVEAQLHKLDEIKAQIEKEKKKLEKEIEKVKKT